MKIAHRCFSTWVEYGGGQMEGCGPRRHRRHGDLRVLLPHVNSLNVLSYWIRLRTTTGT